MLAADAPDFLTISVAMLISKTLKVLTAGTGLHKIELHGIVAVNPALCHQEYRRRPGFDDGVTTDGL